MQYEKSWIVIKSGKATTVTRFHESLKEAREEAERLAAKEQGKFGVFELIGIAEVCRPPAEWRKIK